MVTQKPEHARSSVKDGVKSRTSGNVNANPEYFHNRLVTGQ